MNSEKFANEYNFRKPNYQKLKSALDHIILGKLYEEGVTSFDCASRIKEVGSAKKKFESKGYQDPFQEMTDLVGYRIVVYLESEIETVDRIIRECFDIDEDNSVNKLTPTDLKVVGYRSLHIVGRLGVHREQLNEYSGICDLPFEIQIRTILQHTWAEIEHKQRYKADHSLPPRLQRRLNILAGTLELLDQELSEISDAARLYNNRVRAGHRKTDEDALTASSIVAVCEKFLENSESKLIDMESADFDDLISELEEVGINRVSELRSALSKPDAKIFPNSDNPVFLPALLRTAMMAKDSKLFYERVAKLKNMRVPKTFLKYLTDLGIENINYIESQQEKY